MLEIVVVQGGEGYERGLDADGVGLQLYALCPRLRRIVDARDPVREGWMQEQLGLAEGQEVDINDLKILESERKLWKRPLIRGNIHYHVRGLVGNSLRIRDICCTTVAGEESLFCYSLGPSVNVESS